MNIIVEFVAFLLMICRGERMGIPQHMKFVPVAALSLVTRITQLIQQNDIEASGFQQGLFG